jgi:hypothetical protein
VSKRGGDDDEQSFADVLNNLNYGSWRSGGPREGSEESLSKLAPVPARRPPPASATPDQWDEPATSASVVRPYAWTRGRTRPVVDLEVETLVSTSEHGLDVAALTSEEHRAVAQLCRDPRSVAEVAALLSLPLGVARVLLGDMAGIGLVVVHRTASSSGNTPDVSLMERVLSGLRRL